VTGTNWDFSDFVDRTPNPEIHSPQQSAPSTIDVSPRGSVPSVDYSFASAGPEMASSIARGKPPVIWLVACAVVVTAAGLLAALWGGQPQWAMVAWVASGPIAIGLLGAFTLFDTRAHAKSVYSAAGWVKPAYVACLLLCAVAIGISALRIAFWLGRLG
jgi:hypothetical protein